MNALKTIDTVENVAIVGGLTISLVDIQTVMGIVLLAIQIVLIFVKVILKVRERIKDGDAKGAIEDIEKAQDEIDQRAKGK